MLAQEPEALFLEYAEHLVRAFGDDAGHDEIALLLQEAPEQPGHRDQHVRDDVRADEIIACAEFVPQCLVADDVAAVRRVAVGGDAILAGVLDCRAHGIVHDIHRRRRGRAEQDRPDREDTAAAAKVEHAVVVMQDGLRQLQTKPRGVMLSRAEARRRVDLQNGAGVPLRDGLYF